MVISGRTPELWERLLRDLKAFVDVGLGPYDLPPPKPTSATAWSFNREGNAEGWAIMMGMRELKVQDGCLRAVTTTTDPAFIGPTMAVKAKQWPFIVIRMRVSGQRHPEEALQMFWATTTAGISEAASCRVPLATDNEFHTYVLPVGENRRWRGIIRGLRFDHVLLTV